MSAWLTGVLQNQLGPIALFIRSASLFGRLRDLDGALREIRSGRLNLSHTTRRAGALLIRYWFNLQFVALYPPRRGGWSGLTEGCGNSYSIIADARQLVLDTPADTLLVDERRLWSIRERCRAADNGTAPFLCAMDTAKLYGSCQAITRSTTPRWRLAFSSIFIVKTVHKVQKETCKKCN